MCVRWICLAVAVLVATGCGRADKGGFDSSGMLEADVSAKELHLPEIIEHKDTSDQPSASVDIPADSDLLDLSDLGSVDVADILGEAVEDATTDGTYQVNDVADDQPGPDVPAPCVPDCEGKQCGPDGCDGECGACEVGTACDESECVDLSQIEMAFGENPVEPSWFSIVSTAWPDGMTVNCYADGLFVGNFSSTMFELTGMATGYPMICCVLTYNGLELKHCGAWACMPKKYSGLCETTADCDDGNPCTGQGCSVGECGYNRLGSDGCCMSDWECPCVDGVPDVCEDNLCQQYWPEE